VLQGFALTLGALCLASTLVVPWWPLELLSATRRTPPPTEYFPWLGNTWFLVLKTLGLSGGALWSLYMFAALPLLAIVLRTPLEPRRPPGDVVALGLLAAFFVAPYGRHYDFPVLLIPLLILMEDRLSEKQAAVLLLSLILIPYLQFVLLVRYSRVVIPKV